MIPICEKQHSHQNQTQREHHRNDETQNQFTDQLNSAMNDPRAQQEKFENDLISNQWFRQQRKRAVSQRGQVCPSRPDSSCRSLYIANNNMPSETQSNNFRDIRSILQDKKKRIRNQKRKPSSRAVTWSHSLQASCCSSEPPKCSPSRCGLVVLANNGSKRSNSSDRNSCTSCC